MNILENMNIQNNIQNEEIKCKKHDCSLECVWGDKWICEKCFEEDMCGFVFTNDERKAYD